MQGMPRGISATWAGAPQRTKTETTEKRSVATADPDRYAGVERICAKDTGGRAWHLWPQCRGGQPLPMLSAPRPNGRKLQELLKSPTSLRDVCKHPELLEKGLGPRRAAAASGLRTALRQASPRA